MDVKECMDIFVSHGEKGVLCAIETGSDSTTIAGFALCVALLSLGTIVYSASVAKKQYKVMEKQSETTQEQVVALKTQIVAHERAEDAKRESHSSNTLKAMENEAQIAKKRAMLDILVKLNSDADWMANREKFISLKGQKAGLAQWANKNGASTQVVRRQLNQYELIASGIKNEILSQELYHSFYRTTVVRDFVAAYPFIIAERSTLGGASFYKEFEDLAIKFAKAKEIEDILPEIAKQKIATGEPEI
ncbi:DUF4760 domain-containing protein [Lentilitoribacter sp. Alg239-R112]|uniref:DUF4760 domain-containing protein n=1 Tax=Lentilitoribacter sp. Alg239-R112 TaxID=2305987 RepID=UPI0013A68AAC|nr:DUF4760 domain-containing protein [Lentilitoribacter sp. Alg239-R112]